MQHADVPDKGYFVPPTVVAVDDPGDGRWPVTRCSGRCSRCCGPPTWTRRSPSPTDSDYALTGWCVLALARRHRRCGQRLRAGNVYVNRPITGAVVGRQPFGGYGLSGVGSKAGGPDYLLQFLDPRVVTENTLRQGFAPDL